MPEGKIISLVTQGSGVRPGLVDPEGSQTPIRFDEADLVEGTIYDDLARDDRVAYTYDPGTGRARRVRPVGRRLRITGTPGDPPRRADRVGRACGSW
jgi:hypothetical protein